MCVFLQIHGPRDTFQIDPSEQGARTTRLQKMRIRRTLNLSMSQFHQDRSQQGDRAGRQQHELGQRRELRDPVDRIAGTRVEEEAEGSQEEAQGEEVEEEA